MPISRQFKALGRIAGFFAATWGAIGVAFGMLGGGAFAAAFTTFGVMWEVPRRPRSSRCRPRPWAVP